MSRSRIHCPRFFDGTRLREDVVLQVEAGRVLALSEGTGADALRLPPGWVLAPGLIDIQVNGGGGLLFNDAPTRETVQGIARAHAWCGTTALLPTFITDAPAALDAAVRAVAASIAGGDAGVLGVHLEGPFLQAARRGIHPQAFIGEFGPQDVARLGALGARGRTLVTLAPERVAVEHIRALAQAGVLVFAGHTASSSERMAEAVAEGGLLGVTHLFNAMSQLGPREAGVLGHALLHPKLWAGLILDRHHVGRDSFELAWRLRGRERTVLVSDAMTPAGTPATHFMLQGRRIEVQDGRCVDAAGTLAGAAITLADAVRIGIQHYGMRPEDALYCASTAPARLLGLAQERGSLHPGALADLVVFDAGWQVQAVMQGGRWLREPAHA